jgi:hypothetical protein
VAGILLNLVFVLFKLFKAPERAAIEIDLDD